MVKIKFETDNAAFEEGFKEMEVARLLRELADKIEAGDGDNLTTVRDINGNKVGTITVDLEDE